MPKWTRKRSALLKKLPEEVQAIRQAYPQASVERFRTDEHRIGLCANPAASLGPERNLCQSRGGTTL